MPEMLGACEAVVEICLIEVRREGFKYLEPSHPNCCESGEGVLNWHRMSAVGIDSGHAFSGGFVFLFALGIVLKWKGCGICELGARF